MFVCCRIRNKTCSADFSKIRWKGGTRAKKLLDFGGTETVSRYVMVRVGLRLRLDGSCNTHDTPRRWVCRWGVTPCVIYRSIVLLSNDLRGVAFQLNVDFWLFFSKSSSFLKTVHMSLRFSSDADNVRLKMIVLLLLWVQPAAIS